MIKDYFSQHTRMAVSIVLFAIISVLSTFCSPWDIGQNMFTAMSEATSEEEFPKIVSFILGFSLFGFIDALTLLLGFFKEHDFSMMFIFSVSAMFFYAKLIQDFITANFDDEYTFIENAIMDFIYDNILSYIISIILFFLYSPISEKVSSVMDSSVRTNGNVIAKIVVGILLAILIIIPAIPYALYFAAYMFSIEFAITILNMLNFSISDGAIIIKSLVLIILSIVFVFGINCIVSGYFGKFIRKITRKFFTNRLLQEN